MKIKFKYDYKNSCRNILLFLFFATFVIGLTLVTRDILSSIIVFLISICFIIGAIFFQKRGFLINYKKNKLIIFDYFWIEKIDLKDILSIEVREIKKKNKGNKSFFSLLFIHNAIGNQEIEMHDYIYNSGKVFNVIINIRSKNGGYSVYKSYFGWLYREKNIKKVEKVENQLIEFVKQLNDLCKDNRKNKT